MQARLCNKQHRGFAVVTVLFVIGILLVLATALTMSAVLNSQNTVGADTRERAYNTSESGIADVLTGLGNGTITSTFNQTWTNGNTFPQAQDPDESYDYYVSFNNSTTTPTAVADPLTSTGGACGSSSKPGFGCVALPPNSVFIAVNGHYSGRTVSTEAVAVANDLSLNGYTLLTKGNAGTNGNGNIAADPCFATPCPGSSLTHNVKVFTDGSFNGGKGLIDGSVTSAGTATATLPAGCSYCAATSNATPVPFPASNNIQQRENQWKALAQSQGHFYGPAAGLPASITINSGDYWFIDQGIDLKSIAVTNNGGVIVVTGGITESGNKSAANYSLGNNCNQTCSCHQQAQLIDLSSNGVAMHGQGTGAGHVVSQGVVFAPNGPVVNIGNGTMQAAVVAASAQIGGTASMTADTCAAQAQITLPGYNITGYGEH